MGYESNKGMNTFETVSQKYRGLSFAERVKGYRFERPMGAFLRTCRLCNIGDTKF
jgi:hypothetical protein